jgi:endoglucanase
MIGMLLINSNIFAATYNYAEALQKAIYFYECQQSGILPDWNRAKGLWRGDAQLGCAVQGGWVDAGDNVKFGLPMANSAAMLGWAYYEWSSAFIASGQDAALKNNLKFVCDYFVRCDRGSDMCYQIGDGGTDHSFWGPIEVTEKKKGVYPAYYCKASCVTAETAAALALGYLVLGDSSYLTHAKSLFNLADATRSDADYTKAAGFYQSWSGFWDELCFAAIWLYIATNDSSYLTKAESYVANFNKQGQTTDIEYKYGNSWDDNHYADLLLLTRITGKAEYKKAIENNLNWWTVGVNGEKITYTPGGLAWLQEWGPLRYAMNTSFLAFIYADFVGDTTLKSRYQDFAIRQVNYCLGENPNNRSYVVGFGTNPPKHPHHRTAHGSWSDQQSVPANHRHTIYGALVGGPGSKDAYEDVISNYTTNEIACDYNAAFVGCLAKMYSLYGGTALANFPAPDPKDDEFFVEASVNSSGPHYTEIKALCNNRSGFPARFVKNLNFNYYFDLSELFSAGYSVSDVKVTTNYVEFPVTISPVTQLSGNIYYVKISFNDGTSIYPGGQSEYAGEVQFRVAGPQNTNFWNPANDYSYTGLTNTVTKTSYIPVFDGTTLLYGTVPPVGPTSTPTPTAPPVTPTPRTPTPTVPPVTPTPTVPPVTPTLTPTQEPTPTVTPVPTTYTLNVTCVSLTEYPVNGVMISLNPPGQSFNGTATYSYSSGTQVRIQLNILQPSPLIWEHVFSSWGGDAAGSYGTSRDITITMDSDKNVTANFVVKYHGGTPTPTVPTVTPTPTVPPVTPTPTVPVTPTPTPTPTYVPPAGVKVQFYNQVTTATGNQIYANFKLVNTSISAIALSDVKIRYYYTIDGTKPQNFWCDYSPVGSSNVTGSFVTMTAPKTGADTYLEVGFTSGAGNLAAGASIVIQTRSAKNDWSNYTHSNDYSFNSSATNYVDWTKVTGYVSGVLSWGVEP